MHGKIGIKPSARTTLSELVSRRSISPAVPKSKPSTTPFARERTQLPITAVIPFAARFVITVFETSKAAIFTSGIASSFVTRILFL